MEQQEIAKTKTLGAAAMSRADAIEAAAVANEEEKDEEVQAVDTKVVIDVDMNAEQ